MKDHQPFADFEVENDILVALALLGIDFKRHQQPLSQRRLGLRSQRSLTTKDPKRFGYLKLLDFMYGSKKEKWFLDSGCPRHMTRDKSNLPSSQEENEKCVTFGDNRKCRITRHDSIGKISTSIIKNVLLVNGLKHNLLSISQLTDKGFKVIF